MLIREHNRELLVSFITDNYGKQIESPIFVFREKSVTGVENALDLLGDSYKVFAIDELKTKPIRFNIHAGCVDKESVNN